MSKILHLDASGRHDGSLSRLLSKLTVETLAKGESTTTYRDIGQDLPVVDDLTIGAFFTKAEERSDEQQKALHLSDALVEELQNHDLYVIGLPMYNFSVPAAFKAWADLVARAGMTFKYTDNGPVGLLENKKAIIVISTGGTPVGSDYDYLTPWLKFYLGFLGITDIEFVKADGSARHHDQVVEDAKAQIQSIASAL